MDSPEITRIDAEYATRQICFIAGKLHHRFAIIPDVGDTSMVLGRYEWRPIPSFDTMEDADRAWVGE